jgi:flotillin
LIERASRIPLRTIPIEVKIENAFSKGGIPLEVHGIANVKIASDPPQVFNNAVERLLDLSLAEIHQIAKDTLEGNLRGVLATLSPEEVNEDRLKFANELIEEADADLKRLGLQLDSLKIQNVTDRTGYLDSIGRAKNAEILRIAAVAEADSTAETNEKQAESEQRSQVARAEAAVQIAVAQNVLRVRKAELDQEAVSKENIAVAEAERAGVMVEQRVQEARIQLERLRLQADIVEPAEAERKAAQLRAEADAALIREKGLAQVAVFEALMAQMVGGGERALQVYLAEKLPDLFQRAADSLDEIRIDRMVVMDGDGEGMSRVANQKPAAIVGMIEQVAGSLGIDMEAVLRRTGVGASPRRAEDSEPPLEAVALPTEPKKS